MRQGGALCACARQFAGKLVPKTVKTDLLHDGDGRARVRFGLATPAVEREGDFCRARCAWQQIVLLRHVPTSVLPS